MYNPAASLSPKSPSAATIKRRPPPCLLLLSASLPQTLRGADQLALFLTAIADRSGFLIEQNPVAALSPPSVAHISHAPYFYHDTLMAIILVLGNSITAIPYYYR